MQYNHGTLGLGAVQKGQIVKNLQIRFILCWSFRKGSVSLTLTRVAGLVAAGLAGFFYKYTPLPNFIVENDPRRKILPFLAWRERLKATRGYFRHRHWRKVEPATWTGGMFNPPLAVAETHRSRHRGWREVA
jgi:hypothetical protein